MKKGAHCVVPSEVFEERQMHQEKSSFLKTWVTNQAEAGKDLARLTRQQLEFSDQQTSSLVFLVFAFQTRRDETRLS